MTEMPAPTPELTEAIAALLAELGQDRLIQLAGLIADVEQDTQYGDVKIVIAEGRVQRLKAEKSYP